MMSVRGVRVMAINKEELFDYRAFIAKHGGGTVTKYGDKHTVYAQGDAADALYYIVSGSVKVTIFSEYGKEAVIGILAAGDFFGEGCLDGQLLRNSTIATTSPSEIVRLERAVVVRALHDDPAFAELFMGFILERNQKLQADLIDQLFNSSEKRLARILLTLANTGLGTKSNTISMAINQEMLATMVGTTRSRINQFMNKFRKLGYIQYNGNIEVNNSLLNLILHEQPNGNHDRPQGDNA
jgi:CRP-like cAMP-binding protein